MEIETKDNKEGYEVDHNGIDYQEKEALSHFIIYSKLEIKKGKILMIHGWAQNANVLKHYSKSLTRKLNQAGYDCIFINGPYILPMKSIIEINGEKVEVDNGKRENARAWFLYSKADSADAALALKETPMSYVGLGNSCSLICNVLKKEVGENEFCGLLGFSQGAVMVHMLSAITCNAMSQNGETVNNNNISDIKKDPNEIESILQQFRKIKCSILISGFTAMHNEAILPYLPSPISFTNLLNIPSFHVIGANDTSVHPSLSKKLHSCFAYPFNKNDKSNVLYHEKGHIIPQRSNDCSKIIQFVDENNN